MKILLTGGSGDVGTLLSIELLAQGHELVNIDLTPPKIKGTTFIEGSITDRGVLASAMHGVDCVIHIAAWHGIHEKTKTPADFHDLNVTGTFNTLDAAARSHVKRFIFVSSTSVDDVYGLYGSTKILGEEMVRAHAERYPQTRYITLRPRAFVPSWNKTVYASFVEWSHWFMKGAVHIADFKNALLAALALDTSDKASVFIIDGAYDYSAEDLANWGPDTIARYYPDAPEMALKYGLDLSRKPKVLNIQAYQKLPGYAPQYSMRHLLDELKRYGTDGPPAPFKEKS